ncbi:ABC transporter permease [Lutimaribacter sp. EGI FJ00015]|uniref:ABC transporter permease n=1 Tax=Lutimaribacter degradans TaxID=2945989 RepID=A0ACC5ZVV8_9RHOB|nr:ABC transporter permease [Lutimaribacter sp. EGI FJ00013]MCM2562451.1 ABC transporter permease [Lutimaribacter sp. EGI FJ00013]MCO0613608.1 ABC transporter permease [Lutimaribacter sp. EGI FJ00015]MCO0636580.1 ABC transporter permease [Lutimaribacter sp. EGI FJ00014]
MEPLTWTGSLGNILDPILFVLVPVFLALIVLRIAVSVLLPAPTMHTNPDGTLSATSGGPAVLVPKMGNWTGLGLLALVLTYLIAGAIMGATGAGIIGGMSQQLVPVWIALVVLFALSINFKRKLGLYGKLFDSTIGMIGFGLVMFWVFTGLFAGFDMLLTHGALDQLSGMKNKGPGTPLRSPEDGQFQWYLLGGDTLARDVFSRMLKGSTVVIAIAPLATLFAFMVGITLGLPAGYYGGKLDTFLSFLANLILAFPVILLFYLLVTPEIAATGLPQFMAVALFIFPLIFCAVLINARYRGQPSKNWTYLAIVLVPLFLLYMSVINAQNSKIDFWPLDFFDIPSGILVVFVSVVFVNSPTVFRIVRGLTMDIKTRDYVAAAQTRGEGPWYIMLWEILPNARGPLIVDFCLRIGYTTILLGTLGFFGLGLPPASPDWGSTINEGRKLLSIYLHPALPPAIALLSLVLGLNLLADGLREESLKD